jgi:beta-lactamase regulating signal transducer with metallopeptidase domain
METLFAFLLKASMGIVLFYMVYWLFLRNETFYKANRWFLLLALVISVLLPAFPVQYAVMYEPVNVAGAVNALSNAFGNAEILTRPENIVSGSLNWKHGITFIYLTGAGIFLLILLFQTAVLVQLILKFRIKKIKGMRIVENKKYGLPFSFFNIIFINPKCYTQEDLPEILAHENIHIRENHWFDLLFIELLTVIFWFNPFIWFFERSIKQNHEYLAGKGVISMGYSVARYKAL